MISKLLISILSLLLLPTVHSYTVYLDRNFGQKNTCLDGLETNAYSKLVPPPPVPPALPDPVTYFLISSGSYSSLCRSSCKFNTFTSSSFLYSFNII